MYTKGKGRGADGKITSLLFREWRLNRKAQLLQLLLTLLYAGMMWAACLSNMYGDSLEDPAERAMTLRWMIQLSALMLALLSGCLGLSMDFTLKSDLESGCSGIPTPCPLPPGTGCLPGCSGAPLQRGSGRFSPC